MTTRTITLTPDGEAFNVTWTRVGGSTTYGVVTDADDATYLTAACASLQQIKLSLTSDDLCGFVQSARIGLRHKKDIVGTGTNTFRVGIVPTTGPFIGQAVLPAPTTSIVSEEIAVPLSAGGGVDAPSGDINQTSLAGLHLLVIVTGGGTESWLIYEMYLELDVEENWPGIMQMF